MIEHFTKLGITAVELMPVHHFVHDDRLVRLGLRNYWGYNSIAYLAPYSGYSYRGGHRAVNEFKAMVRALHAAHIEVILDVVYNHTAEGNHLGPTLAFRGIDNPSYYRLVDGQPRFYSDSTGTGNSLNVRNPHVLQLMMDSLRYWVLEMHVDGFRFDLAASLARQFHEVDRLSAFFDIIQQDPVISQVKLIAEPWDVGDGGYQVGNFPPLWSEWNGKYRDTVRDYWRQSGAPIGDLAERLTGSSDLYEATGRRPFASINFVTCHDGFTLADLVSYNEKHNEANGEDGRDGTDDNRSWNCGVEGPTDDPKVLALRRQQVRNFLATLFLSQGVPMLLGGDELGRTQARQQQRLLPGLTDLVVRLGERRPGTSGVDAAPDRPAAGPSRLPPAPLLPGPSPAPAGCRHPQCQGRPVARHRVVSPRWRRDDRRRLGGRLRQVARGVPQRWCHPRSRYPRPTGRRRLLLPDLQCVGSGDRLHAARRPLGGIVGGRARQRRRPSRTGPGLPASRRSAGTVAHVARPPPSGPAIRRSPKIRRTEHCPRTVIPGAYAPSCRYHARVRGRCQCPTRCRFRMHER